MNRIYIIQSTILCFVGIGALFGGAIAIIDPYEALLGISTELLKKGPFSNFLIPGLFLFIVIGLGHLLSFWFVKRKMKFHPYLSGAMGCILMAWIVIQCYILETINILHVIYFAIGVIEGLVSLYMLVKLRLFPFDKGNKSLTKD
ncbi:hypothetical protein [Lutispora thermophila]|uniref:Uncharacterized protein n=1 Tax=Lutispora thermophila DSM 19022 TaxID=1122184 RepID=A0A1M6H294_9FIRM|nr:hypothetical protein [Lutispora thermophila]SHJ16317.1 hypothetical protein SAMN02745176_02616 [Lutispora thermophila DSM 19022]